MPALRFALASLLVFVAACGDQSLVPDATLGACVDTIDNDGDGTIDFPEDLGCADAEDDSEEGAAGAACSDNRDNDGDMLIDYPLDPGCAVPQQDSETDDCPNGPTCAQCADGMDNDNNGSMDYPDDPGCVAAGDGIEFTDNQVACGPGLTISQLPSSGTYTGMVGAGSVSNLSTPCGGGGGAAAQAFVFHVTAPTVVVASTGDALTDFDTVLDLRSTMCSDAGAEIACHDNISSTNKASEITRAIDPGTYYLIVQGKTPADMGSFVLNVDLLPGQGQPCAMTTDCGPGLVCRIPFGETDLLCASPVCSDGVDDDSDGKMDYPLDPGCTSITDDTEEDTCSTSPSDPACPACANGVDDDGDLLVDYPDDPTCVSASVTQESCAQSEPITVVTSPQTVSTTVGMVNDHRPPPGSFNGHLCSVSATGNHTAPDRAFELELPATTTLSIKLAAQSGALFDSSHSLYPASCSGTPIECYDSATGMVLSNIAAGRYYLIVDGYSTAQGAFVMNVTGTIVPGESCEMPLAQSGALVCSTGFACGGTPGSRTCIPAECNDSIDNNGDGRMDFPADPGCVSISDGAENTVCPGPSCPACADGLDNDGDNQIDYPMDTDCVSAAAVIEGCRETEPLVAITGPLTTGTLVGATDDHNPRCVTTNHADRIYTLTLPVRLETLTIDTENSAVNTVLSFMNTLCDEPSIACDDDGGVGTGDSLITLNDIDPGTYTIAVDADATPLDTFNLNVHGTIGPNGSCESAMYQSGMLSCRADLACKGLAGQRTCQPAECFDGLDNNGDGRFDYPNDPGCLSGSDDTEQDVCPGAACPACADGLDNDGDNATDFPADTACASAAGGSESCVDTDAIQPIVLPMTSSTLVGATNDHFPTCAGTGGNDHVYTLTVPLLQSLTLDTEGSTVETVLSLMNADCSGPEIACDDDGGVGTGDSLITRTFTPAGTYTVHVEADVATPNTYNLNVRGVIPPGASCDYPLVDTGVLVCAFGFACNGTPGSRACTVSACADGVDNNGDGRTDFPNDPSCSSFSDATEENVCPGPSCPVCGDGVDNDEDGRIDYPDDPSCFIAASLNETCRQSEVTRTITDIFTTGTTTGAANDIPVSCSTSSSQTAGEVTYRLDVPATLETLTLNLRGYAGAHTLFDRTCVTEIACSDPEIMTRTNVAPGTYFLSIDGSSTGVGDWSLTTTGVIAPGGSCEGALADAGSFVCRTGHLCTGAAGSRTCTPGLASCGDGMDNDGDGKMDFPSDPGCLSATDTDETDPCPGAGCPLCGNAIDDDGDMMTDQADSRCVSASFFLEDFCPIEANVASMIVTPQTAGTLVGAMDNYEQSCQPSTSNDVAFGLELPVPVTELTIHTLGSVANDTVVSLWTANCGTELGCDDDSAPGTDSRAVLVVPNVPAGNYAVQVDAFGTAAANVAPFVLTVKGTVAAGTACTSPLFASGVLECENNTACTAGTCQ